MTVQALRWPILIKIPSNIPFCVAFMDSMSTKKFGSPSLGSFCDVLTNKTISTIVMQLQLTNGSGVTWPIQL